MSEGVTCNIWLTIISYLKNNNALGGGDRWPLMLLFQPSHVKSAASQSLRWL
jgi:hypothetical protein